MLAKTCRMTSLEDMNRQKKSPVRSMCVQQRHGLTKLMFAGITPMRPFLMEFAKQGRPATLLYSARTAAEIAFHPQLQKLEAESAGSIRVFVNITQRDDSWGGHIGRMNASYVSAKVGRLCSECPQQPGSGSGLDKLQSSL